MFNEKGQAFSVFKILIAGIVALAILGILLPLLGGIVTPQSDPKDIAQTLVKNNYSSRYTLSKSSQDVIFKKGSELSSKGIVEKVPALLPEQICVSAGEYADREIFTVSSGGTLMIYDSPSSQSFKIAVFCATGEDLESELSDRNLDIALDCDCTSSDNAGDVCCLVFPVKN
ncbi:MAG: hypothetical protein JW703_04360 [Candidatus Diapherotrites archaeon]|nr:hypothetical protein [Candidatus Diapherotrites archaeon]